MTRRQSRMEHTVDGLAQLARHESSALMAHLAALGERWAVARKARSTGELLRDQLDLLPSTAARLKRDQTTRRELLRELRQY